LRHSRRDESKRVRSVNVWFICAAPHTNLAQTRTRRSSGGSLFRNLWSLCFPTKMRSSQALDENANLLVLLLLYCLTEISTSAILNDPLSLCRNNLIKHASKERKRAGGGISYVIAWSARSRLVVACVRGNVVLYLLVCGFKRANVDEQRQRGTRI